MWACLFNAVNFYGDQQSNGLKEGEDEDAYSVIMWKMSAFKFVESESKKKGKTEQKWNRGVYL